MVTSLYKCGCRYYQYELFEFFRKLYLLNLARKKRTKTKAQTDIGALCP